MEHVVRLASSNASFYATVFGFAFWVILWFVWARFFHEGVAFKRACQIVLACVLLMFFFACYASVAADGLDGVVCAARRFSIHLSCYSHDESPWLFWALVMWLMTTFVLFMLIALAILLKLLVPGDKRAIAGGENQRGSIDTAERRPATRAQGWTALQALQFAWGVIVISNLAWIAHSLHQLSVARKQVTEALASVTREKAAVEDYLNGHGALPEGNEAAGLLPPGDLRGQYFSEIEVSRGSLVMKFGEMSADEHLAGRVLMLIGLRRGTRMSWRCATLDIDDKYLPDRCQSGLK